MVCIQALSNWIYNHNIHLHVQLTCPCTCTCTYTSKHIHVHEFLDAHVHESLSYNINLQIFANFLKNFCKYFLKLSCVCAFSTCGFNWHWSKAHPIFYWINSTMNRTTCIIFGKEVILVLNLKVVWSLKDSISLKPTWKFTFSNL